MHEICKIKSRLVLLIIVLLSLATIACSGSPTAQKVSESSIEGNSTLSKVALEVPTIWCFTCQPRVKASAKSVPGVSDVRFDNQTVIVTYDPAQTSPDTIVQAIERGGDSVTKVTAL